VTAGASNVWVGMVLGGIECWILLREGFRPLNRMGGCFGYQKLVGQVLILLEDIYDIC